MCQSPRACYAAPVTATPTRTLDTAALRLFEAKGAENAVRVRRVMQLTADLARRPWSDLRILDLACGEGVFAIEAALRGASVVAIDGRTERMQHGEAAARRIGLENVTFIQDDVRLVTPERLGRFDVVYVLGLLYHLDAPDVFRFLDAVRELCTGFAIVDTHVSRRAESAAIHDGRSYEGRSYQEHAAGDAPEVVRSHLRASLDNAESFWFTRPALYRALHEAGFTSVLECHVPFAPFTGEDRATFVAAVGGGVRVAAYPWLDGLTEERITAELRGRVARQVPATRRLIRSIRRLSRRLGARVR